MNTYWTEAAQLYLILHQSCFSLKSDHQDLLRSFTFTVPQRRNDLHLTSSEEPLFLHLSICIALYVWIIYISSYWDILLRVTTDMYIILCQYLLYCYKDLIDLHYKHQNLIIKISASASKFIFLNKIKQFFFFIFSLYQTIWVLKSLMDKLWYKNIKHMWRWSTKAVISNTGIFVAIANNTLYESKLLIFLLCQKSLGY